jgi:5-methylcytosine-specific restriction endonuclease McrA
MLFISMRIYEKKFLDITGKQYNNLKAVCYVATRNGRAWWRFLCDCGVEVEKEAKSVRTGNTKSCGCRKQHLPIESLLGRRFGYLTVTAHLGQIGKTKDHWWQCKCDCGNETSIIAATLNRGHTKSCGCLAREVTTALNKTRSGPNHPSWDPTITVEDREVRRNERKCSSPRLNRWRKKVYERDKYTCQKCGDVRGGNLVAHHIYSWAHYTKLRYVTTNGVTLCEECHKDFHKQFGRKKNTRKQLTEWIGNELDHLESNG